MKNPLRILHIAVSSVFVLKTNYGSFLDIPEFGNWKDSALPVSFNPLLLVKDFSSSEELKTDDSFMTNADVPYFEFKDLNLPLSEKAVCFG